VVGVIFANCLNKNNRIYSVDSCEVIIENFKEKKQTIGVLYGELGHPDNNDVSLRNVSHTINDMWLDGNVLKAEIETLNTVSGNILEKNIEQMVFSSRSLGYVDSVTNHVSIKKFITIDAIDCEKDAYYKQRVREKKLKRILKDGL